MYKIIGSNMLQRNFNIDKEGDQWGGGLLLLNFTACSFVMLIYGDVFNGVNSLICYLVYIIICNYKCKGADVTHAI